MEIGDDLGVIAEIGITFAGFLAIFLVLASRDGRFSPADSIQVVTIICSGFGTVLYALAPLVLFRLAFEPELALRASSGIAIASILPQGVYFEHAFRRLRIQTDSRGNQPLLQQYFGRSMALLIGMLHASVVFWVLGPASVGVYLLALLLGLVTGASAFVGLAMSRLLSQASS